MTDLFCNRSFYSFRLYQQPTTPMKWLKHWFKLKLFYLISLNDWQTSSRQQVTLYILIVWLVNAIYFQVSLLRGPVTPGIISIRLIFTTRSVPVGNCWAISVPSPMYAWDTHRKPGSVPYFIQYSLILAYRRILAAEWYVGLFPLSKITHHILISGNV